VQVASMEKVYQKWKDKVKFYLVYHFDPHTEQGIFRNIHQPQNMEERLKLAYRLREEKKMQMPILVDEVPRKVSKLYGGLPNMIYIIDPEGKVAYYNRWTDVKEIVAFLRKVL
jgi:hypothetical protein